jgi:hypothetical protein
VKWNGIESSEFSATNGVKQGGIMSPLFFCIYVDDLLLQLKNSGSGCHIGSIFYGAFGYADDLTLLSPSVSGMKHMLSICDTYAKKYFILFNASKSHAIVFRTKANRNNKYVQLYINGTKIQYVNDVKHLGHILSNKCETLVDVDHIGNILNKSVNMLMSDLGSVPSYVLIQLFRQYCGSLYGIVLCD